MKNVKMLTILVGLMFCLVGVSKAAPMGTAFTYQGQLFDANYPANGSYDFSFKLYDAISDGNQIGVDVNLADVDVVDGYFTVELDFGNGVFSGDARWLGVGVRPGEMNDPNGYTTLSPRQEVMPAPHASYADSSNWNKLISIPADINDGDDIGITSETDPTVLSSVKDGITWSEVSDRPAGLDDGDDIGITSETDPTVLSSVKDGITWTEISSRPAGLDDGDDVGGLTLPYSEHVSTSGNAFYIENTGSGNAGYFEATGTTYGWGLYGGTPGGSGSGVFGEAWGSYGHGVFGSSSGSGGEGVHGFASDNGGTSTNIGGYFESQGGVGRGVYGWASNSGDYLNYGGYFRSNGTSGRGVFGVATGNSGMGVVGSGKEYDFYAIGSGVDYGSSSSIRWKRNIELIDSPLEKMKQLRGVYFNWDAEHGGQHDVGMIAEEVGKVLPEIVRYEQNGIDATGMDYSKLTPLLVEAVKALETEIDQLEKENADLRNRVEALENEVLGSNNP